MMLRLSVALGSETDTRATSEVETKRRRLDGLREPDRPSSPSTSRYPSVEKNEVFHGVSTGESCVYRELEIPHAVFIDRAGPFVHL